MATEISEALVRSLAEMPTETEWVEFKRNIQEPEHIGEYISALSNSAALKGKPHAYMVWGVSDDEHAIVGTTFNPFTQKKGNEPLKIWLKRLLQPRICFDFHKLSINEQAVVVLEIEQAHTNPVSFRGTEYIRVGSCKTKLNAWPDEQRTLWTILLGGNVDRRTEVAIRRSERNAKREGGLVEPCPKCEADTYVPAVDIDLKAEWKCLHCHYEGQPPPTDGGEWTDWSRP